MGWSESGRESSTLPEPEAGELRLPVCLRPTAPRCLPKMVASGGLRHRWDHDQVVLEQLILRLPKGMAEWVQCHRPASLEEAVRLAAVHMAAIPRAEEPSTLSPLPLCFPLSHPLPLSPLVLLSPQGPFLPHTGEEDFSHRDQIPGHGRQHLPLSPCPAALPLRWERPPTQVRMCEDPGHFWDQCPLMELGTAVRVSDLPQAAPDRAGAYRIP
ncbi:uncharacterized protein LOC127454073 [Myxocyprinus asiaticus]|uniref:uncharacterized protein LOC127454073 n=1 Tax=Myxocyprinus asiaticus TaxID=70543 RepID=UPI002222D553|nr:uncharacterized protein LOC127454073 [Myxocyprinus asiaticus]